MTLETIEQIVALLKEYPVSEIALEQEGQRLLVRRPLLPPAAPPPALAVEAAPVAPSEPLVEETVPAEAPAEPALLTATMVGLFHHATPPVSYGTQVALGQAVGSIESIKVMNDVPATEAGRVVDVFVEEGAPVEYGQALFRLAPE
ncbi:MAG: biotin/lipoyl-binding protein [Armatimonadetes bacterium]|nr:biotin/lipoyl-binding protein [Armatimonadota bacterium]